MIAPPEIPALSRGHIIRDLVLAFYKGSIDSFNKNLANLEKEIEKYNTAVESYHIENTSKLERIVFVNELLDIDVTVLNPEITFLNINSTVLGTMKTLKLVPYIKQLTNISKEQIVIIQELNKKLNNKDLTEILEENERLATVLQANAGKEEIKAPPKESQITLPLAEEQPIHVKPVLLIEDDGLTQENKAYMSDPLAFHSNTKRGIYVSLFISLIFILIAYKMENEFLRDGFSSMFLAMTNEFHPQPDDSSTHVNHRTTARVGFVALLVFGATAIGGFIGSRFKPNEEKVSAAATAASK